MEIKSVQDFKLIDRNKASAEVDVVLSGEEVKSLWIFYLQADYCVSIRAGKILTGNCTVKEMDDQVFEHRVHIKSLVKPDIERVRAERRALMGYTN